MDSPAIKLQLCSLQSFILWPLNACSSHSNLPVVRSIQDVAFSLNVCPSATVNYSLTVRLSFVNLSFSFTCSSLDVYGHCNHLSLYASDTEMEMIVDSCPYEIEIDIQDVALNATL